MLKKKKVKFWRSFETDPEWRRSSRRHGNASQWNRQTWSRGGREGLWGEEDSRASDGELQEVNVSQCKREKSADLVSFMIEARLKSTLPGRVQFSSVSVLSDSLQPHDHSTPGLPVHHQLQEFNQTHVYWVGDAIQPSHPLSSPFPPAFNLSQHQGLFKWVSSWHQVAKLLEFQLQHQFFQWIFRTNFL